MGAGEGGGGGRQSCEKQGTAEKSLRLIGQRAQEKTLHWPVHQGTHFQDYHTPLPDKFPFFSQKFCQAKFDDVRHLFYIYECPTPQ